MKLCLGTFMWTMHVCNKANIARSFLQHNLKQCPSSVRQRCYLTLVRPILEYACAVWLLYTLNYLENRKHTKKGSEICM